MAQIELLFGGPNTLAEEIEIEKDAYGWDVCIETAVIRRFQSTCNNLIRKNKAGDHFFELLIYVECLQMLKLPKMSSGTYRHNGFVLPKLTIHGEYGVDKQNGKKFLLSAKHFNAMGKGIEENFDIEYFEYRRTGVITALKGEMIYLLGDEPHIFDAEKFYKAKIQQK